MGDIPNISSCKDCDMRLILCLLEQLKEKGFFGAGGTGQIPDLSNYYTSEQVDNLLLPFSEQISDFLLQVVLSNGSYANPSWLTSLSWSKIINRGNTLADYGILDAVNLATVNNAIAQAIADVVNGSPTTLNTLSEIAAALGNDPNFATTLTNLIATKVSSTGSYVNPSWLVSIPWSKVSNRGNTLADYGITDAAKIIAGTSLQSGTGIVTQFIIAHGLGATPTKFNITPSSVDAKNYSYATADGINLYVNYDLAPASGSNNVSLSWMVAE